VSPTPPPSADALRERLQASLGHTYTLERELGGGGMSRVFLAQETEFGRAIVVKLLPPDAAETLSAERFKREIAVAAKLQHPHIVPLLSAGEMGGLPYYTMPYVEGESLRARLMREGELPIGETVGILREVARALAYAHERGVVHRDIKPDNVMLSGGTAVVTDFGVAKAVSASTTQGDRATTITQLGVALGTPAYMAPEQASADPNVDARADLYAFGCMAYEMLTGSPPFSGRPPTALLAAHVAETPEPVQRRRPNIPPALAVLVMQCLEKRPADRPRDANAVVRSLDAISITPGTNASVAMPAYVATGASAVRGRNVRQWIPWLVAAALALALGFALTRGRAGSNAPPPPEIRTTIALPDGWRFIVSADGLPMVGLSHDGRWLAVHVQRGDSTMIAMRSLSGDAWRFVPGSDAASGVSFSDDDRFFVFHDEGRNAIVRLPIDGGTPTRFATGDWTATLAADGALYYDNAYNSGVSRVASPGAVPQALTHPDTARHELGDWSPQLLPDLRHLLVSTYATPLSSAHIDVVSLSDGKRSTLVQGAALGQVVDDVLLYSKDGSIQAVPFDARKSAVAGASQAVLDSDAVSLTGGAAEFGVARSGTLAFVPDRVSTPDRELVWLDRSGHATSLGAAAAVYRDPQLSPDATRVAVTVARSGLSSVFVYEIARGLLTRISPPDADAPAAAWGRDGRDLFYNVETPVYDVFRRSSDASGAAQRISLGRADEVVNEVTPDGRMLLVEHAPPEHTDARLATIDLTTPGHDAVDLPMNDRGSTKGSLSADGHWLAYTSSTESGRSEVYVRSYPDVGNVRRQISTSGGVSPRWTRGGREIVFLQGNDMVSASFDPATGRSTRPVVLFDASLIVDGGFDVTPDGSRFLAVRSPAQVPQYVVVVANWLQNVRAALGAKAP